MFYFLVILMLHFLNMNTFNARIIWQKDISIGSDKLDNTDLERISPEMINAFNLGIDESKLERLHFLVNSDRQPREEYKDVELQEYDYQIDYDNTGKNQSRKRMAGESQDYGTTNKAFLNGSLSEDDYNFVKFKEEYEEVTIKEADIPTVSSANMSVIHVDSDKPFQQSKSYEETYQCVTMPNWQYILFGVPCLWHEIKHLKSSGKFMNMLIIFTKTTISWLVIWLFMGIALWFYKGVFCCCIKNELVHPFEGIARIQKEALGYGPGKYRVDGVEQPDHDPSEAEIKAYRDLITMFRS